VILAEAELSAIRKQAEAEYPAECCGVVLVRENPPGRTVMACRNIQDEKHAEDPVRFPRDARHAYYMDPRDIQAFTRREVEGWRVEVIYHSHVDVGAYFSETDRRNALVDGEPAYPDAIYVVVAVRDGAAGEANAFRWDPAARDFVALSQAVG
jgi:[CysO sulfur-carrier protein]-S-L-cysteine hydrolase